MYSNPSILQPFKTTLAYKTTQFGPKVPLCVLNLYFKTTCNIRPHFLGPIGGLKIEGLLYSLYLAIMAEGYISRADCNISICCGPHRER